MAGEIQSPVPADYAIVLAAAGQAWNGAAFVTIDPADSDDYDVPLEQVAGGVKLWLGDFPAGIPAGSYTIAGFRLAGGAPDLAADFVVGVETFRWAGTAREPVQTGDSFAALPRAVRKNTALANFAFVMVDSGDHVTPKAGLTVTAQRSIDGGAFAACSNSPAAIGGGVYRIDLDAPDLDGDVVVLRLTATGADPRIVTVVTQP